MNTGQKIIGKKPCIICSKDFEYRTPTKKYCCMTCKNKAKPYIKKSRPDRNQSVANDAMVLGLTLDEVKTLGKKFLLANPVVVETLKLRRQLTGKTSKYTIIDSDILQIRKKETRIKLNHKNNKK